ncbi:hypothetical protein BSL78_00920 [Apostichopus japonicus]|uniref:Peptidase A2 domain-containing protein n=1 Tax=Stichopus japonicus TaxID=307972 RepID=A0A2G8LPM0_STIJA|nr:hypothetical protein BSL78_00920 [Apostichopus japonicus]
MQDVPNKIKSVKKAPRQQKHDKRNQQKVHTVDEANSDTGTEGSGNSDFFNDVLEFQQCKTADGEWNINLLVEDVKVNFKLDTGSQCNVIFSSVLENMENVKLRRSKMHLITYSGDKLKPMGKCVLLYEHKNRYYDLSFQVVKGMKETLIWLESVHSPRTDSTYRQCGVIENSRTTGQLQ